MKKHLFTMTCLILVSIGLTSCFSSLKPDTEYGSEGEYSWEFDYSTRTLTFTGGGQIKCPSDLEKVVEKVIINEGVTSIGEYAFTNCSGLTSVTIPNSIASVGEGAFRDCNSLTSVHISDIAAWYTISFGSISANPLSYAQNLYLNGELVKDLVIPNSVTNIGEYAFSYCSLTSVTIPNSVTNIGEYAFSYCSSLTSVTIPTNVTNIGEYAFYGCSSLTSVHISDIAAWCSIAFGSTSANPLYCAHKLYLNGELVKDLVIPDSVTRIGDNAFSGCGSLTSVTIHTNVTRIGAKAFSGCTNIASVVWNARICNSGNFGSQVKTFTFGEEVEIIPDSLCNGMNSITSITIPKSVTRIGAKAFSGCTNIASVVWNARNCNSWNFGSQVKTFTFGEEVEIIPDNLCNGMSSITSITIPNSVAKIGQNAFKDCSSLKSVHISDIAAWCNISFLYSDKEYSNPLKYADNLYLNGELVKDLVIPNSVTSIGNAAFYGCSLSSVTIGNSVTSIGTYAFKDCSSLSAVTFGNSVTSIGYAAFSYCTSLSAVTIGNSVTSIGYEAFYYCSSLSSVTIGNSVTSIESDAFRVCNALRSVTCYAVTPPYLKSDSFYQKDIDLYVPAESVSRYKTAAWWNDFRSISAIR